MDVDDIAGMGVEVVEGTVEEKEAREEIVEVEDVVKGGNWMSVGDEMATTVLTTVSMSLGSGQCDETSRAAHPPCEMTATQLDTRQGADPVTSPTRHFESILETRSLTSASPSRTRTWSHPWPWTRCCMAGHHAGHEAAAAAHWSHTSSTCQRITQALRSQWAM